MSILYLMDQMDQAVLSLKDIIEDLDGTTVDDDIENTQACRNLLIKVLGAIDEYHKQQTFKTPTFNLVSTDLLEETFEKTFTATVAVLNEAAKRPVIVEREPKHHPVELAERLLANSRCPADIVAFGKRHNIPMFAEKTWEAGFAQGMRVAVQAQTHKIPGAFECGWCGDQFDSDVERYRHLKCCGVYMQGNHRAWSLNEIISGSIHRSVLGKL